MLGVAGCLVPELLTKAGVADLPVWSEAGKGVYYTDAVTLFLIQGILMNWVEVLRWQDIKNPGSVNADPIHNTTGFGMPYKLTSTEVGYPGSRFFDPLGMSANPTAFAVNKVKEIKNGRCAFRATRCDSACTFLLSHYSHAHSLLLRTASPCWRAWASWARRTARARCRTPTWQRTWRTPSTSPWRRTRSPSRTSSSRAPRRWQCALQSDALS